MWSFRVFDPKVCPARLQGTKACNAYVVDTIFLNTVRQRPIWLMNIDNTKFNKQLNHLIIDDEQMHIVKSQNSGRAPRTDLLGWIKASSLLRVLWGGIQMGPCGSTLFACQGNGPSVPWSTRGHCWLNSLWITYSYKYREFIDSDRNLQESIHLQSFTGLTRVLALLQNRKYKS